MKEKLLKEKGGAKVYIIIIVLLVVLCVGLGAFAVIKMNQDKEDDDEKTSKKNEVSTSQSKNETDEKENKVNEDDDDDDDEKGPVTYSGILDMTELMGSDELKDTTWTLSLVGDDDSIEKMVIKAELEKFLKDTFESAGGENSGFTYDQFIDEMKKQLNDTSMGSIGKELASEIGADEEDVDVSVNWVDDETMEIEIDLSSISKEDFDIDEDESAIESIVKALEDEGIKMKKSN